MVSIYIYSLKKVGLFGYRSGFGEPAHEEAPNSRNVGPLQGLTSLGTAGYNGPP